MNPAQIAGGFASRTGLLCGGRRERGRPRSTRRVRTAARQKFRYFVTPTAQPAATLGKAFTAARVRSLLCVPTSSQTQTQNEEDSMPARTKRSEKGLLTADNCVIALIDHQPQMMFGVAGVDRQS